MRRGGVDTFQVVVQCELRQGLPRWSESVNFDRVHSGRTQRTGTIMAHRTGRYQWDPLHATETQFPSVLFKIVTIEK